MQKGRILQVYEKKEERRRAYSFAVDKRNSTSLDGSAGKVGASNTYGKPRGGTSRYEYNYT